jgi:tetratricopeptide (TPR) repeat protein
MEKTKQFLVWLLVVSAASVAATMDKSPTVLFQEAQYQEQTAGDLDKAIEMYQRVVADSGGVERLAAKATFQLGMCYLKKDDKAKAAEHFKTVISKYRDQKDIVVQARQQLEQIAPHSSGDGGFLSRLPQSVLNRLGALYGQLCANAGAKQIRSNSNIHFVDAQWNHYWGGYGYFMNRTQSPISGKIELFGTSYTNQDFYSRDGKEMTIEFVKDEKLPNYYRILWTPDAPVGSWQMVMYAWSVNEVSKLTSDGMTYSLKMQNHFGQHVSEAFFLVVPDKINLTSPSENYTGKESLDGYTIYSWKKEMPENAEHIVSVTLAPLRDVSPEELAKIVKNAVETISTCAETDPKIKDATDSLAGLEPNRVVTEVCKYLNSDTETVRRAAIYTLWKGGLPDITTAQAKLIELCSHKENFTRGMAALTLGSIKTPVSFEAIKKMTEDSDGYARRCAVYALGLYGDAAAVPVLEKALQDNDPLVKANAQAAITMLTPQEDSVAAKQAKPDKLHSEDLTAEGWKLWQERKLTEAEKKFEEAIAADSNNEAAWQGLGWAQLNQGKKQNAEASFKKCVELNPKNAAALNGLGWIAQGSGDTDAAILWWEKAVKAEPGATAALGGLTKVYMEKQDYRKAIKYYMMWLKVEPNNQDAKEGLEKAKQAAATNPK